MRRRDWIGMAVVVVWLAALLAFRAAVVEPRAFVAGCAGASVPFVCAPRAGLLWLQQHGLWGIPAFLLGLWCLRGAPFAAAVAAVALGAAGVANYNASWGMPGAALGAWAWIMRSGSGGARVPRA